MPYKPRALQDAQRQQQRLQDQLLACEEAMRAARDAATQARREAASLQAGAAQAQTETATLRQKIAALQDEARAEHKTMPESSEEQTSRILCLKAENVAQLPARAAMQCGRRQSQDRAVRHVMSCMKPCSDSFRVQAPCEHHSTCTDCKRDVGIACRAPRPWPGRWRRTVRRHACAPSLQIRARAWRWPSLSSRARRRRTTSRSSSRRAARRDCPSEAAFRLQTAYRL